MSYFSSLFATSGKEYIGGVLLRQQRQEVLVSLSAASAPHLSSLSDHFLGVPREIYQPFNFSTWT